MGHADLTRCLFLKKQIGGRHNEMDNDYPFRHLPMLLYEIDKEWVCSLLDNQFTDREKLKQIYERKLYKWEMTTEKKVSRRQDPKVVAADEARWTLLLNVKYGKAEKAQFKRILELKPSSLAKSKYGMFALRRFERGEIITFDDTRKKSANDSNSFANGEELFLAGDCAVDARTCNNENFGGNNAYALSNGLIRAMQCITPGKEILVEYNSSEHHPVQYLDCVIKEKGWSVRKTRERLGKVVNYSNDRNGNLVYQVKYLDGHVERISGVGLEERLVCCSHKGDPQQLGLNENSRKRKKNM